MADEDNSFSWGAALAAARDVAIARREQPRLIQGIQQAQTPLSRNNNAPIEGAGGVVQSLSNGSGAVALGVGLLALTAIIVLKRKR